MSKLFITQRYYDKFIDGDDNTNVEAFEELDKLREENKELNKILDIFKRGYGKGERGKEESKNKFYTIEDFPFGNFIIANYSDFYEDEMKITDEEYNLLVKWLGTEIIEKYRGRLQNK